MTTKHTPGPWGMYPYSKYDGEGYQIGSQDEYVTEALGKANAEFIVRACNSHDELYEAAQKLIMHRNQGNLHPIDFQRLEQALAKVDRETLNL